jgi:DNA-directed RNA polymerase III subunit RPC5
VIARRNTARERRRDSDEESDGPPPDPDDPNPPAPVVKKAKKTGEIKEVQVTARKAEEKSGQQLFGGLSQIRREILSKMREEKEEPWENLDWCDIEASIDISFLEDIAPMNLTIACPD